MKEAIGGVFSLEFIVIFLLIVMIFSEKIGDSKSNKRNLQSGADEFQNINIYIDDECIGSSSSSQTSAESLLSCSSCQEDQQHFSSVFPEQMQLSLPLTYLQVHSCWHQVQGKSVSIDFVF